MAESLTLVLGGARSGKSAYAQQLLEAEGRPVLFVATATAGDEEMAVRIANHKAGRPEHWRTLEVPLRVGKAILDADFKGDVLLDCITLLASNLLMTCADPLDEKVYQAGMRREIDEILDACGKHTGRWVMVSNEVGLGLVPPTPLGRCYRDELGRANQRLAAAADRVIFMVAGISMTVK